MKSKVPEELNPHTRKKFEAIVEDCNITKHGGQGHDAFILEWRLVPNKASDYYQLFKPGGPEAVPFAEVTENDVGGCGCGCA